MPDADSFDTFYRETGRRVIACVYAVTGDLSEAQEATQEAYTRAWERWRTVSTYDGPEAWVRRVAIRIATSRWRKARSRAAAQRRHGAALATPPPGEDTVMLVAALRRLPAEQRVALVLHHLGGLTVEGVARETDVPLGTVKARLFRGRKALSELLGAQLEGDSSYV